MDSAEMPPIGLPTPTLPLQGGGKGRGCFDPGVLKNLLIIIKGAGEMGTGVAHRLATCGFRVCLTEVPQPLAVRREVCFCEAVYEGEKRVEGVLARRAADIAEIRREWERGNAPVIVDPECSIRDSLRPHAIVDAILAKRNTGTVSGDAPLVVALGPGFSAGEDVHFVIETNRGHDLGRVIEKGQAEPDTGIPGSIAGLTWERVLRAPAAGKIRGAKRIGDAVAAEEVVAEVEGEPLRCKIPGVLRGLIHDGVTVHRGMKVGDVDPRGIRGHCFTISDKARAIAGGVLEAVLRKYNR
ncbi:MAG TPA: selenium-dependent molybdenum cofactor biosynthesis protein YqeB [Thermodesulfobacteriota bacterium]|nr:selenium-dependent molybdenum cofactor biosynthesis protein YqeB [Thermodesulfobacteriota bacterium]